MLLAVASSSSSWEPQWGVWLAYLCLPLSYQPAVAALCVKTQKCVCGCACVSLDWKSVMLAKPLALSRLALYLWNPVGISLFWNSFCVWLGGGRWVACIHFTIDNAGSGSFTCSRASRLGKCESHSHACNLLENKTVVESAPWLVLKRQAAHYNLQNTVCQRNGGYKGC